MQSFDARTRIRFGHLCCTALAAKEDPIAAEAEKPSSARCHVRFGHVWTTPWQELTDDIGCAQMVPKGASYRLGG
jgi:hypothetical protein